MLLEKYWVPPLIKMDKQTFEISDNQSADQLNKARQLLFKTIDEPLFNQL